MSIDDRIKGLIGYFREQVQLILSLEVPGAADGQISLYRKTLFISIFDCLAGIRYPELVKQNRRRFTRFLEEFASWPTGSLVSLPFLVSRLEKESLEGKLLVRARAQLASFDPQAGNSIRLRDIDLTLDELRPFAKREAEEKALEDVQYWSLLYRYRNHLVHEFREPGYGMEVFAEDRGEACYHNYINDPRFYLVYPVDLFRSLAESAVAGLEVYFLG
jgi:hypothetical protein